MLRSCRWTPAARDFCTLFSARARRLQLLALLAPGVQPEGAAESNAKHGAPAGTNETARFNALDLEGSVIWIGPSA